MGQAPHSGATTMHAVRAAIQRSKAPLKELAARHGLDRETVAKRRTRRRTEEGKLHVFVAVDRTSKPPSPGWPKATTTTARAFLEELVQAVPCKVRVVLTVSGLRVRPAPV